MKNVGVIFGGVTCEHEVSIVTGLQLIENIDKLHTTPMGIDRIRKNLKLDLGDVASYCKSLILNPKCHITKQGKNWYCEFKSTIITVNSHSYTIITAHKKTPI